MTSWNDRVVVDRFEVSALYFYFTKANEGLYVFVVVRVGGSADVLIQHKPYRKPYKALLQIVSLHLSQNHFLRAQRVIFFFLSAGKHVCVYEMCLITFIGIIIIICSSLTWC